MPAEAVQGMLCCSVSVLTHIQDNMTAVLVIFEEGAPKPVPGYVSGFSQEARTPSTTGESK